MSSYNKINEKHVVLKGEKYVIGESYNGTQESFLKEYEKTSLQIIEQNLKEKEEEMLRQLEKKKKEIEEKMYNEAYERAYISARKDVEEELNDLIAETNHEYEQCNNWKKEIVEAKETEKERMLKENKKEIIEIALTLAEKIVSTKLKNDDEVYLTYLQDSIDENSDGNKKIYVVMNPKAYRKIEPEKLKNVEILLDNNLKYEDILIETEKEVIDLSINERIEQWRKLLD